MPDIFLSYNREDQARAKLFAEGFERQGLKVWWDVGLTPSASFTKRSGALEMWVEAMRAGATERPAQALASARRCRVVLMVGMIAIAVLIMM